MQQGFPLQLSRLLRCPADEGELQPIAAAAQRFVEEGAARCSRCSREYPIRNGILSLLGPERLHPESATEMQIRNAKNQTILAGTQAEWRSPMAVATEMEPTLAAVAAEPGMLVLELGCGTGRYTLALLQPGGAVVAIDFSLPGLLVLRQKLATDAPVAIVQADVTHPYAAPRAFDRALSTLHSNLPNREQRAASLSHVAHALKDDGRAVISMHHYNVRDVLSGVPAAGRYPDSGIYRYCLRRDEASHEHLPFFARVRFVYVSAGVPLFRSVRVAKTVAKIPVVRSALGRLFLAVCEGPKHDAHGQASARLARQSRDGHA